MRMTHDQRCGNTSPMHARCRAPTAAQPRDKQYLQHRCRKLGKHLGILAFDGKGWFAPVRYLRPRLKTALPCRLWTNLGPGCWPGCIIVSCTIAIDE